MADFEIKKTLDFKGLACPMPIVKTSMEMPKISVGDVVEGVLVGGDADEYDALHALSRLAAGGTVRVERPAETAGGDPLSGRPPQPELER